MNKVINKRGDVYGDLTVIQEVRHGKGKPRQIRCQCGCGNRVTVLLGNLRSGKTKSCGCALVHGRPNVLARFNKTKAGRKHLKTLHASLRGRHAATFGERFWSKVNKDTGYLSPVCDPSFGECWEWIGSTNGNGYGQVTICSVRKAPMLATHVAFFLANGYLPEKLCMSAITADASDLRTWSMVQMPTTPMTPK